MSKDKKHTDLPPFFRTWTQIYVTVASCLVFFIVFLYWFSKLYN